jgi:polynucleotide 5'-hydroxyl-kinase GRC3/NOL9
MTFQIPSEWEQPISDIISSPGIVVVIGAVDTGKTSLCTFLANHALKAGIPTAVVDGDIGQSEIGPPTTIGLGLVESEIDSLSDLKPYSLYFVGSTSPVGHLLATATGVKTRSDMACALGKKLVIVDTTGLVRGLIGRKLKTAKIESLRPRHIIALQREKEVEHILRLFDTWEECTIHRLPVSPAVKPKTPLLRMQRRLVRLQEYFEGSETHTISLENVATAGTWLRTGDPLEPRYLKFAENELKMPILYGEMLDSGVYLVAGDAEMPDPRGVDQIREQFRVKHVIIVPASRYLHLVVALVDSRLEVLSLGVIREIDFRALTANVSTPLRSFAPVKSIRFGVLKLRPDWSEIGRLRPGEV